MIAGRDVDWVEAMAGAPGRLCAGGGNGSAVHPLHLGHHGQPKGVVRDNGGHVVALKWTMKIFTTWMPATYTGRPPMSAGWWATPTLSTARCSRAAPPSCSKENRWARPDAGVFWRVISEHKVKAMFTAPTAFRAIKREDPNAELMKEVRPVQLQGPVLAGERPTRTRCTGRKTPQGPGHRPLVADRDRLGHCANCMGLHEFPVKEGSPTKPAPGWNLQVVDADNKQVAAGRDRRPGGQAAPATGHPADLVAERRALRRILPGRVSRVLQDRRCGFIDADGYAYVMSRTDDIINVAGHRLSTGAMEEVLPTIRMWPSAPCWVWMTASRARCRWVLWCSRPG
jgi:propionyl-CoA synthetase